MPASLNYGLRVVNWNLDNKRLMLGSIFRMNTSVETTLADRLRKVFGDDKPPTVARKLDLHGTPISYQAIYKWLKGGDVSDEFIVAVADLYGCDKAWLKYGGRHHVNRVVQIMHTLPEEKQAKVANFVESLIGL